jgi:hypothetical protein
MGCIAPNAISEEQLLAYADGEGDNVTIEHIRHCDYCAQKARAYTADQALLRAVFYRVECPDPQTLGEYHQGLVPPSEQAAIAKHLTICRLCSTEIADLDHFLQEVPTIPHLLSLSSQLKRLVAHKIPLSDGGIPHPALALRGTAAASPDVYRAEDIRLVVGVEADGLQAGRKMLLGFILREGESLASLTGAQVQLRAGETTVAVEQVDRSGNFVFRGLGSGKYELILLTDREQVVIESIVV